MNTLAGFSPDQLQFIGMICITFGSGFVLVIWRVATWKANIEKDVDNLGYMMGTEKGIAKHEAKLAKKYKWYRLKK